MKQVVIIVGIIAIIGVGFSFLMGGKESPVPLSIKQEELPVLLYKEQGFVAWKKEGETNYSEMKEDEKALPNKVSVMTSETGRGYVVLPDNSTISLSNNTEIIISYEPKKVSIMQLLGSTYHRVEALVSGKEYEVRTPGTLAAVRGTKFAVTYDKKRRKTNVSVTEHRVDVAQLDTRNEQASSTVKRVEAGLTAIVEDAPQTGTSTQQASASTPLVIQKTEKSIEEKRWIDENTALDKELDRRKDNRKEYIKEFIKQIKEENETSSAKPQPVTTSDQTKERIRIIQKVIQDIKTERPDLKENVAPTEEVKTETKIETEVKTTTQTNTSLTTGAISPTTITTPALKIFDVSKDVLTSEEERFTDEFYKQYETYFYADQTGSVCERISSISPPEMVLRLEKFTNQAGYVLPKKEALLSLATALVTSCRDKTIANTAPVLQNRFDEAYPFAQ